MQPDKSSPFPKGPSPRSGGSPSIELVGTAEYPEKTLQSISWSPDGRFLATFTSKQVCLWQLPGKSPLESTMPGEDEKHSNKKASSIMPEEVEITKVGDNGVVFGVLPSGQEVRDA